MIQTPTLSNLAFITQNTTNQVANSIPHTPEKKRNVEQFWLKASNISFTQYHPKIKEEKKTSEEKKVKDEKKVVKKESTDIKSKIKNFISSFSKSPKKSKTYSPKSSPSKTVLPTKSPLKSPKRKPIDERPILVLDLDETLIHSNFQPISNPDFICTYGEEHNKQLNYVRIRPGARELLNYLSLFYQIVIFTAGIERYAKEVIQKLDTQKVVSKVFYRDSCIPSNRGYIKDLRVISSCLSRVIIVDNNPISFYVQPENGIECTTWIDDDFDSELFFLTNYLYFIRNDLDLRHSLLKTFISSF